VGSHLVRALARDGCEVHAVLRASSDRAALGDALRGVERHTHDGSTAGLISIVRAARPAIVFHLASLFVAEHRPEEVEPLVLSNLLFGAQLLEAMSVCGVRSLVNTGTSWQHYRGRSYSPVCLYAATKQAYEDLVQFYVEAQDLRVLTLLLSDTYGPGDRRPKLFRALREHRASGVPLALSGGSQILDLVHVDDVARADRVAARRLRAFRKGGHERYAVHGREPTRLRDLVELYAALTRTKPSVSWGARPYRRREMMTPWMGGRRLPGWRPRMSLRKGLRELGDE